MRVTPFSGQGVHSQQRELVIVHGLIAPFLEVIAHAINLLLMGLVALIVLVVTTRMIVLSIIPKRVVKLSGVMIASVP
jgi:Na+-translocating ferredoxin:NAD+ oxidoreductase RnfE subunit